jgi:hypothetical protein
MIETNDKQNKVEITIRLHHPDANEYILDRWFKVFYIDLLNDDDIYKMNYNYKKINSRPNSCILLVNIVFYTPMNFEEIIEYIHCLIEFKNTEIYTIRKNIVSIELYNDEIKYNNESFFLQDLTIRNSKTNERLSELKVSWNQT